jgi:hypothetical protein
MVYRGVIPMKVMHISFEVNSRRLFCSHSQVVEKSALAKQRLQAPSRYFDITLKTT